MSIPTKIYPKLFDKNIKGNTMDDGFTNYRYNIRISTGDIKKEKHIEKVNFSEN